MFLTLATSFIPLVSFVVAIPQGTLVSSLVARQSEVSPLRDCNATYGFWIATEKACIGTDPHCRCNTDYLQAEGNYLLCQSETAQESAAAQLFLDTGISLCHSEGIPISFKLQLPSDAQAIVDEFYHQSSNLRKEQTAFLALQIAGGHIGLVIVLTFAIFSHKVRRDPTFLNFCITWILSSVVYSILLYHRTEANTISNFLGRVSPDKCVTQAALINGAQVMTACSTMALVIQLWIGLREAIHGSLFNSPRYKQLMTILLLTLPYILFLAFSIPSILVAKPYVHFAEADKRRALPTRFYCSVIGIHSLSYHESIRAIYGATLSLLVITIVFDILILIILYRYWRAFRQVQTKANGGGVSLAILLRVIFFSIYRVAVAITYGAVLDKPPKGNSSFLLSNFYNVVLVVPIWTDMLQAAIPLVAFLALGTNSDILHTMMFWRKINR